MKSYLGLWLLLALTLVGFILFSFVDGEINIGGFSPKKAPFKDMLLPDEKKEVIASNLEDTINEKKEIIVDSLPQTILLFGDSMTFNIALRMAEYAKQNGHTIHSINWDSSNTKIWAESDTLDYFINKFKPTFIFISLGSNEVYFKDPYQRLPYVEKILDKIGAIPYVWIGPPNWNEDTGINDMLKSATDFGTFFKSEGIELKRKKDKIHPTRQASAIWVDSIMRWIPTSKHPILVEIPSDTIGKSNPGIIFLKALNK